jgi:hypothetical protein
MVLNPELFEVASVLTSLKSKVVFDAEIVELLKSGDAATVLISLKSASPLKSGEVT